MSAVHHHSSWGATRSGLARGQIDFGMGKPVSFSAKKSPITMTHACFQEIAKHTLEVVRDAALKAIKAPTGRSSFSMATNFAIDDAAAELAAVAVESKSSAKKGKVGPVEKEMATLCQLSGLTPPEYATCVKLAKTFASKYFASRYPLTDGKPMFAYSSTRSDIANWHDQTFLAMTNFSYASVAMACSETPISFSADDLAFFGVAESPVDPTRISCLAFALLQAKDRGAATVIFDRTRADIFDRTRADAVLHNLDTYLKDLSYRPVDAPDTGDLVVYFNDGRPVHVGYFGEDGRVHSKLGVANPYSHRHRLFDVPAVYGNHVVFYRKSPALFSEAELTAEEGKGEGA